jgi:hypothetical protein
MLAAWRSTFFFLGKDCHLVICKQKVFDNVMMRLDFQVPVWIVKYCHQSPLCQLVAEFVSVNGTGITEQIFPVRCCYGQSDDR